MSHVISIVSVLFFNFIKKNFLIKLQKKLLAKIDKSYLLVCVLNYYNRVTDKVYEYTRTRDNSS